MRLKESFILTFLCILLLDGFTEGKTQPSLSLEAPAVILRNVPFSLTLHSLGVNEPCFLEITTKSGEPLLKERSVSNQEGTCEFRGMTISRFGSFNYRVETGTGATLQRSGRVLPGWVSLLPPLFAVLLAILFRQVILALVLGIWLGATFLYDFNPLIGLFRTLDHYIVFAYADTQHVFIICFSLLLGGMIGVISKSGGTLGLVQSLSRIARSSVSAQFAVWLMGVLVFFDDYANCLFVGTSMRPLCDKYRVSREKLSYLVDTMAAPIANLAIISTWIGFEVSVIGDTFRQHSIGKDPYMTFLTSIPYRFYPIFALIFALLVIVTRRDFGPMLKAETRARSTGAVLSDGAKPLTNYESSDLLPEPHIRPRWTLAIIPIFTAIFSILLGLWHSGAKALTTAGLSDLHGLEYVREILVRADSFQSLLWGSAAGGLVAGLMALLVTRMSLQSVIDAWVGGMRSMFLAVIILGLAWAIGKLCSDIQTAGFLVHFLGPHLSPYWLPALTTLVSAGISFATGSSWTTMGIVMPLVIPLAYLRTEALGPEAQSFFIIATVSSVLAGATFGDHCSPISDTTILSSMFSGSDHMDHVNTQIPYAIIVGIIGWIMGDIATAYGFPWWGALIVGTFILWGILRTVGQKVEIYTGESVTVISPEQPAKDVRVQIQDDVNPISQYDCDKTPGA